MSDSVMFGNTILESLFSFSNTKASSELSESAGLQPIPG